MENEEIVKSASVKVNFTVIGNNIIEDERLSIESRFILIYLRHLPPDWISNKVDIQNRLKIGRRVVDRCFDELHNAGYLVQVDMVKTGSLFPSKGYVAYPYSIFEQPITLYSTDVQNVQQGDISDVQNVQLINTNNTQEKVSKKKSGGNPKPPGKPKRVFNPPTEQEVLAYFRENGQTDFQAKKAYNFYAKFDWTDSQGKKVKNWKQKMLNNWFTDTPDQKQITPLDGDARMMALYEKGYKNCTPEELRWVYDWQHRSSASQLAYPNNVRLVKPTSHLSKQDCIDADRAAGFN